MTFTLLDHDDAGCALWTIRNGLQCALNDNPDENRFASAMTSIDHARDALDELMYAQHGALSRTRCYYRGSALCVSVPTVWDLAEAVGVLTDLAGRHRSANQGKIKAAGYLETASKTIMDVVKGRGEWFVGIPPA